jgi:hypothetical protein
MKVSLTAAYISFVLAVGFPANTFGSPTDSVYSAVPQSFTVHTPDYITGVTTNGLFFSQHRIVSTPDVRIHKFSIAESFFYISDRGIIEAPNDLRALSMYLAKAV